MTSASRQLPAKHRDPLAALPAIALVTVVGAALCFTAARIEAVQYLSGDGGHYLSDAYALMFRGVRPLGHPPAFPLLALIWLQVAPPLKAVGFSIITALVINIAGFWWFVRGRGLPRDAERAGVLAYALFPGFAELVGWNGGATLLGVALLPIALQFLENALLTPRPRTSVLALLGCLALALTHPFIAVFALESAFLFAAWQLMVARPGSLRRAVAVLLILVLAAATVLVANRLSLLVTPEAHNPFRLGWAPDQLQVASAFAPIISAAGMLVVLVTGTLIPGRGKGLGALKLVAVLPTTIVPGLLFGGMGGLLLVRHRTLSDAGHRFLVWSGAIALVCFLNLLFLRADPGYAVRSAYPIGIAIAGAAVFAVLRYHQAPTPGRMVRAAARVAFALAFAVALLTYLFATSTAIAYYNQLSPAELEAIRWLQGHAGVVVVGTKHEDTVASTSYAWMLQGLARVPAVGAAERGQLLLQGERAMSLDADRFLSGDVVIEGAGLRVGAGTGEVQLQAQVEGNWWRVASIAAGEGDVVTMPSAGVVVFRFREPGRHALEIDRAAGCDLGFAQPRPAASRLRPCGLGGPSGRAHPGQLGPVVSGAIGSARISIETDTEGPWDGTAMVHPDDILVQSGPSATRLVVRIGGMDGGGAGIQMFNREQLREADGISTVYAWSGDRLTKMLVASPCLRQMDRNSEVVVLRSLPPPECHGSSNMATLALR